PRHIVGVGVVPEFLVTLERARWPGERCLSLQRDLLSRRTGPVVIHPLRIEQAPRMTTPVHLAVDHHFLADKRHNRDIAAGPWLAVNDTVADDLEPLDYRRADPAHSDLLRVLIVKIA